MMECWNSGMLLLTLVKVYTSLPPPIHPIFHSSNIPLFPNSPIPTVHYSNIP